MPIPPKIDQNRCILCGKCIFVCGRYVLTLEAEQEKIIPSRAKECIDCFICSIACPKSAINIYRRVR